MGKTRGRCVNISLCMCVIFSKKKRETIIKTVKEMSKIYNGEKPALQSTLGR